MSIRLLLAIGLVTIGSARAADFSYSFIDFPNSSPGCVWVWGINDLGWMTISDCTGNGNAAAYVYFPPQPNQPAHLMQIAHPNAGAGGTTVGAISNSGEVVGTYFDNTGIAHGYTYQVSSNTWTTIDRGGSYQGTRVRAIALRAGESVGIAGSVAPPTVASIYNANRSVINPDPASVWQELDGSGDPVSGALNAMPGLPNSLVNGINDLGVMVGMRWGPSGEDSFVYQGGTSIPTCPLLTPTNPTPPPGCTPRWFSFSVPGAWGTEATGIAANGDVVGFTSTSDGAHFDAYIRWHDGTFQLLNVVDPATNYSYAGYAGAGGMNSLGVIAGVAYTPAQWSGTANGARVFIAAPKSAAAAVPATDCSSTAGGCDLSGGIIPHSVVGSSSLPGTVSESTCAVVPDPRITQFGTCTGHTLKVSAVCPGYGDTIIPDYLCGGAGPAGNGFVLARTVAEGVDALANILVNSEAFADKALGGTSAPCPKTVAAWSPRTDSQVEGSIPEGAVLIDLTSGCGSSKVAGRGLSLYGIGLKLNTDALPGATLGAKLRGFAVSKYDNLLATIASGNMTLYERIRINSCVTASKSLFQKNKLRCAARTLVRCDAQVAANISSFSGAPGNPNVYGDIRGRLGNLYLTVNTRLLGNAAPAGWPVTLSSAPSCDD